MAAKKVVSGADRKAALLEAGAKLASKYGAENVTRRMVAKAAKVSEALVAHYMGNKTDAQKAYAKHAKKLGLPLPTKDEAKALGAKLRAHGPRKNPVKRTRSVKEVKAIKRNIAAKTVAEPKAKPAARTAARKPKAPPAHPAPALPPIVPALPALPAPAGEA